MLSDHFRFGFLSLFSTKPPPSSLSCPIVFFHSHYMPIPLQTTFWHFLGYFSHFDPSNYLISYSAQLGDSTNPSQHPHFCHILSFLHCPCLGSVHHCWFYNRFVHFPIDHQAYSSITHNPRFPPPVMSILVVLYVFACKSPFSAHFDPRCLNAITLSKLSPCRLIFEFPSNIRCTLNLLYTVFFLLIFSPCLLSFFSTASLLVLHNTMASTKIMHHGIYIILLSRRPTDPYSWRTGKDSWNILDVAPWRNAHWELVT